MCIEHARRSAAGFTLFELVLLIVVFAIALAGILLVINTTVAASADPMLRKQAMAAAESMMEEILLQPYAVVGTAPATKDQTTRATFNDVRDYSGFATTGIYKINDSSAPITGLGNYNIAVTVTPNSVLGSVTDALLVKVTVTGPRIAYVLEGYKLNIP